MRIRSEIVELIAERTALLEQIASDREGVRVQPAEGQGALLKRTRSSKHSNWLQIDDRNVYCIEDTWGRWFRWQTPRTPELVLRIDVLAGRIARLQAECKAAGRTWESMVKAAVTGEDES